MLPVLPVTPQLRVAKEAAAPLPPAGPRDQELQRGSQNGGSWFPNPDTWGEAMPMGSPGGVGFPAPLPTMTILRLWVGAPFCAAALGIQHLLSMCTLKPGCWLPQQTPPSRRRYRFELQPVVSQDVPTKVTEMGVPFIKTVLSWP